MLVVALCGACGSSGVSQSEYDAVVAERDEWKAKYIAISSNELEIVEGTHIESGEAINVSANEGNLSELVTVVEEYFYESIIGSTYHVLVIKNNSSKTVDVDINATAIDAEGKIIGAGDTDETAIASGSEACLLNYFKGVKGAASFSYTLTVEESKNYDAVTQDLAIEQSITDRKVIISCTNSGSEIAEFVQVYGLFFKDGELVCHDSAYITDSDSEIKPNATISKELNSNKNFDEVKIYLSGRKRK